MRIQVVECPICFLAAMPSTFVHSLDLLVATTGALMLLSAWNRNERVDLRQRVRGLFRGTKYDEWHGRNARCLPDQSAALRLMGFLAQMHRYQGNCMVRAYPGDGQRNVEANAEDTLVEARGHGIETCRVARRASMEDMWDSRQLYLDLQVHRR